MSRYPYGFLDLMDPDRPMPVLPGDSYAPPPPAVAEAEPEEDPEEDPEEEPFEEEEYEPYGSEPESEPDDAQEDEGPPEESLTDEEIISPPQSPQRPSSSPSCHKGKGPMQTARITTFPGRSADVFYFTAQPRAPTREQGESSRAPPPARIPTPLTNSLADTVATVEHRVTEVEEEQQGMHQAVQVLYHRAGASRTEAISQDARLHELEYRLHQTESRLDHAEHRAQEAEAEYRRLHELHKALLRHLGTRFGL